MRLQTKDNVFAYQLNYLTNNYVYNQPLPLYTPFTAFAPLSMTSSPLPSTAVIKSLSGDFYQSNARASTSPAKYGANINVSAFGKALPNQPVTFWDANADKQISSGNTDSNGNIPLNLSATHAQNMSVEAFLGDQKQLSVINTTFSFTVWELQITSKNVTDIWARFQGRAINEDLPFGFWNNPKYLYGLAGYVTVVELIPVFSGQTIPYHFGVSAWCATKNPNPTAAECCATPAWWNVDVKARNDYTKSFTDYGNTNINIDYHVDVDMTTSGVSMSKSKISNRCANN